jgi:class 3 adenylate cyclase
MCNSATSCTVTGEVASVIGPKIFFPKIVNPRFLNQKTDEAVVKKAVEKELPQREPRSYTPEHLAEKILTSRSALEGEPKQLAVLFADVEGYRVTRMATGANSGKPP